MQVSEFPIGRGEVYANKHGRTLHLIEVVAVQSVRLGAGRHILIALHEHGKRVPDSERIVFGASAFLRSYRPATAGDCMLSDYRLEPDEMGF